MTTTVPYENYSLDTAVQHSKEHALDELEFELLFEGAQQLKDYYRTQAEACVLILGRLGLRRGELAHMDESWINWQKEMLEIPRQENCHKGKDGGICGECDKLARQRADWNESVELTDSRDWQWLSKTEAAAREIYYGFSPRVQMWLTRFFEEYDEWPYCAQTINRRLTRAAEQAERLDPDEIHPHALRATAASYHAGRGLGTLALTQLMGWKNLSVADVYLSRSSSNTARQLDSIHR